MSKGAYQCYKIVFRVLTTFLFLGFFLIAAFGIVLKTSSSIIKSAANLALDGYTGDTEDLRFFANFVLEIADKMALYCIVVGVILAILTLIGLIASYCMQSLMMKIYGGFLIGLLVVQVIAVAVIFSNPANFNQSIVDSARDLLKYYGSQGERGERATSIWNVLMETDPQCCGMEGYKDFGTPNKGLPLPCCNIKSGTCDATTAQTAGVGGCKQKVELISTIRSTLLLRTSISMIFMQAVLIVLVGLLIYFDTKKETMYA